MPTDVAAVPEPGEKERNAIDFFREYGEDIQHIIRNPSVLADREEWGSFQVLISRLNSAIARSSFSGHTLLFRGAGPGSAETLLFPA